MQQNELILQKGKVKNWTGSERREQMKWSNANRTERMPMGMNGG